jgi:hypothetical protein
MDAAAAVPPPAALLARATDEALTDNGHFTVRRAQNTRARIAAWRRFSLTLAVRPSQMHTLLWALAVNAAVGVLCFGAFGAIRAASPLAAKLFAPRQLLAATEAEADAADYAAAAAARRGGAGADGGVAAERGGTAGGADGAQGGSDGLSKRASALAALSRDHAARVLPPLPARGWMAFLFSIPDEHVIDYAGLDALIFMRFYAVRPVPLTHSVSLARRVL